MLTHTAVQAVNHMYVCRNSYARNSAICETRITFTSDGDNFNLKAWWSRTSRYVDIDIVGGTPFIEKNDLTIRPVNR